MVKIDQELVKKIAGLAKISLSETEVNKFTDEFKSLLSYIDKINEVEVSDKEIFKSQVETTNIMREDKAGTSLNQDDAVWQAKNKNGYVVVPNVIKSE